MPKKTFFNPVQRRCSDAVIHILGYSDALNLQRRSTAAVKELVLRCWVYWPNRLGWRQKVLQPPSMFMLLLWWCSLGHGKRHLPAIQIFIVVRLIPILTHLSSRWTVPLRCKQADINNFIAGVVDTGDKLIACLKCSVKNLFHLPIIETLFSQGIF